MAATAATAETPAKRTGRAPKPVTGDGFAERVAHHLRRMVDERGVDRDWVCRKLGFTLSVYYRIYNAASPAAAGEHLDSLCRLFGVPLETFVAPPAKGNSDALPDAKTRPRRRA